MEIQKLKFLEKEADNYYKRNMCDKSDISNNILYKTIKENLSLDKKKNIIEIGCAHASKLIELNKKYPNNKFYGLDPSKLAINNLKKNKIHGHIGTADHIPYDDNFFDIIIYGFSLYLCDDDLLFKISSECFRCLKPAGVIIIEDFITKKPIYKKYKYLKFIKSRKMNYISMFAWHPKISCIKKIKYLHPNSKIRLENYVTVCVLKKSYK